MDMCVYVYVCMHIYIYICTKETSRPKISTLAAEAQEPIQKRTAASVTASSPLFMGLGFFRVWASGFFEV